jgi:hypothetical protein
VETAISESCRALGQTFMKIVLTPINLIIDAIAFLMPLGAKTGAILSESFKAAGQTIMKVLLTPINLVIEGIKGVLNIASKIPGVGGKMKGALDAVESFQDRMNTALTGSETVLVKEVVRGAAAGYKEGGMAGAVKGGAQGAAATLSEPAKAASAGMADKVAAAEASSMSKVSGLQDFQNKMNVTLTGSESTLTNSGVGFLVDPVKNAIAEMPDKMQDAVEKSLSSVAGIQGFQDKMNVVLTGSTSTLTTNPSTFLSDPFNTHRAEYLAKNPEAAPGTKPVDSADDKWEAALGKLGEMIAAQNGTTEAVEGLADNGSSTSPAALRWGSMGTQDFWEIQRIGV